MSTELAVRQPTPVKDMELMAQKIARSRLFGMDPDQAFTLMLLAESEGLHPMQAMKRFDIVQGRPAMKAAAILAEFQARGGTVKWKERSTKVWSAVFKHPIHAPEGELFSYTMEDAQRAGLAHKENWKKDPSSMLRARLISNAVRTVMPGIVTGIYTPEEVQDMEPVRAVASLATEPSDEPEPEPFHPVETQEYTDSTHLAITEPGSFSEWRDGWVRWGNNWWKSRVGEKPIYAEHPVIVVKFQLQGHFCKWCNEKGWTDFETKDFHRPETADELYDLLGEHCEEMNAEAERYIRSLPKKLAEKLNAKLERNLKAAKREPVGPPDGYGDAYEDDLDEAGQAEQEQDVEQAIEANQGEDE